MFFDILIIPPSVRSLIYLNIQFLNKWHVCPGSYNLKVEMNVGKRAWKEVKKQVRKEMRMEVGKEVGKKLGRKDED